MVAVNEQKHPLSLADDKVSKYSVRFWQIETFDEIDNTKTNNLKS